MNASRHDLDQEFRLSLEPDVLGLDAGGCPESFGVHMCCTPGAGGTKEHLARLGIGERDQFRHRLHAQRRGDDQPDEYAELVVR